MTLITLVDVAQQAAEATSRGDILGWILTVFFAGLGGYLGAYFKKKGENLATKEDIGAITREIEKVKTEYAEKLKGIEFHYQEILNRQGYEHQLKLAALDKRLQAAQEAYVLWRKLRLAVSGKAATLDEVASECQSWWQYNCLFLPAEVREGFHTAYLQAEKYPEYDSSRKKRYWKELNKVGGVIAESMKLPNLGEGETQ